MRAKTLQVGKPVAEDIGAMTDCQRLQLTNVIDVGIKTMKNATLNYLQLDTLPMDSLVEGWMITAGANAKWEYQLPQIHV